MTFLTRGCAALSLALVLATGAQAQSPAKRVPLSAPPLPPIFQPQLGPGPVVPLPGLLAQASVPQRTTTLIAAVALSDIGFADGIRMGNLGAQRDIFLPLPQGTDFTATELSLTFDDLTAFDARRNLEVTVNGRSVAAIALDGRGVERTMRIALGNTKVRDGFVKLGFSYSGVATQDRCIDVRYVGDSLTIRPETALSVEFDAGTLRDVATIAALMPRDVSVVLPAHALTAPEIATALTVARSLAATGRRASFRSGAPENPGTPDADGRLRWTRGTVVIGAWDEVTGAISAPSATAAVPAAAPAPSNPPGTLSAIRVGGMPALLVSDAGAPMRAARLLGNPSLAAARNLAQAEVGAVAGPRLSSDRVTFDQLGITLAPAAVFGRFDFAVAIDTRNLPANTRLSRLALDLMVAPDSGGEKAVVSVFINERLLTSTIALSGEPTRIDIAVPAGLFGTVANIRVMVQRRSAAGECRFEPQGYPAQILGSSAAVLSPADEAQDFSDLATRWTDGVEVLLPPDTATQPRLVLALLSDLLGALSPEAAPVTVKFAEPGAMPGAPFISVSATPPQGATPRVRFDRGRVAVNDRSGRALLDLGGFTSGAVAQLVSAGGHPGIWLKPLAADGALPAPVSLSLDRGDVAFIDGTGLALAMSTTRDTLVNISYPDQVNWTTVAGRFHAWIVGSLWLFATIAFLFALQRMLRRRPRAVDE